MVCLFHASFLLVDCSTFETEKYLEDLHELKNQLYIKHFFFPRKKIISLNKEKEDTHRSISNKPSWFWILSQLEPNVFHKI